MEIKSIFQILPDISGESWWWAHIVSCLQDKSCGLFQIPVQLERKFATDRRVICHEIDRTIVYPLITTYANDNLCRLASMSYPDGRVLSYPKQRRLS
jgi:hypothetical protein